VKNTLLVLLVILSYTVSKGQNRKHAANFSTFQHYYNPAFTGFRGSVVKAYYRNQWAGFEGAPKTLFVSAEINLTRPAESLNASPEEQDSEVKPGIQHAIGFSALSDSFGPFVENQIFANYRSSVHLTHKLQLHAGATLSLHTQALDGSKLTAEEANDPSLGKHINQTTKSSRYDLNIGVALTGENFYLGYGMQNIKGDFGPSKDNFFRSNYALHHVVQAGYRTGLSEEIGVVLNGLMRYDDLLKETLEGQLKTVMYSRAWIGFGYRKSLAYSFQTGFRVKQLQLGYAYEVPIGRAQFLGSTNEVMVSYDLRKATYSKYSRKMSIW
jgi:type IX secretion system PorP/SprF family membrane protein